MTHVWVTGGSEESHLIKFIECYYFHYLCFVYRRARKIVKAYSEASFLGSFNDTSSSSLDVSWVKSHHLKPQKTIWEVSAGFRQQKAPP
jgi:hypothetical protein